MRLLKLALPSGSWTQRILVALILFAAVASVGVLGIINTLTDTRPSLTLLGTYVALVVTLQYATYRAALLIVDMVEGAIHQQSVRISAKLLGARLQFIERMSRGELSEQLSANVGIVSGATAELGNALQSLTVSVLMLVYISWLTPSLLVPLLLVLGLLLFVYIARSRLVSSLMWEQFDERVGFIDRITDLIHGAKELRLGRARARAAHEHFVESSATLRDASTDYNAQWHDNARFLTLNSYLILAVVAFALPTFTDLPHGRLLQLFLALLYMLGNLQTALTHLPMFIDAEQVLARLELLERRLDEEGDASAREIAELLELPKPWAGELGPLELRAVEYSYASRGGEPGFHLGPIDLRVEPGEVLFIVGGNGAGKSTLLKLLTGLYTPTAGSLHLGGRRVSSARLASYRELVSVIFSEVHLFTRAYGQLDADPELVEQLIEQLQLGDRLEFAEGAFSTTKLSRGQTKRLAMVRLLLDDRPIVVLDEWAVDQDPEFRRYFYVRLLPDLRARGKTVIVVSHDDRFFDHADRIVILDYGQIRGPRTP